MKENQLDLSTQQVEGKDMKLVSIIMPTYNREKVMENQLKAFWTKHIKTLS